MKHTSKQISLNEKILRSYKRHLRHIREWCMEHHFNLKPFFEAETYDICIISKNELSIGEFRKNIEDAEEGAFFVEENVFDKYERDNYE